MNRREFTFGLGAVAAAPVVPVAALGNPIVISNAAMGHFKLAKLIARAHDKCSNAMLMRHLKVDAQMAAEVEQLLLSKNVITEPNLQGFSRAINPMNLNCVPKEALHSPKITSTISETGKKLKKLVNEQVETETLQDDTSEDGLDTSEIITDKATDDTITLNASDVNSHS